LPLRSKVSLSVYDILGNKVNTIINQELDPGRHVVTWHAVDRNNNKLSSGVYFYQIRAEKFFDTKKMILIK
jgi:flagellar hook assembly protein FlgD